MRTTLTLDNDVIAKLKEKALLTGQSFKGIVNETLRLGLLSQKNLNQTSLKPFKIKTRSLGIKPGYSYDNVAELLEQAEGPQYK